MPVTNADVAQKAQWDAIVALLQAEVNPSGKLSTVKYVGRSAHLWTENSPAIGVQFNKATVAPYGSMRREMTSTFWIVVGVQSTDATAAANMGADTPPNLEDAMDQLQAIIADGNGNGILPTLNEAQNYSLGGYAYRMIADSVECQWEIGPGKPPAIWAYGVISVTVKQLVNALPA